MLGDLQNSSPSPPQLKNPPVYSTYALVEFVHPYRGGVIGNQSQLAGVMK